MFDTRFSILLLLCVLILLNAASPGSSDSLAQFAATVRLDHDPSTTTIVIDETMLTKNRTSGALTSCNQAIAEAPSAHPESNPSDLGKRRIYWHRLYNQQVEKIGKAQTKLAELDAKIADLDAKEFSAGNSGKARATLRASLDTTRAKRQTQAGILSREEAKLRSLIRQARSEGAQPDWFRD